MPYGGNKQRFTSRGKYIASLVPKIGIPSDGEESEEDEEKIGDEEFEQRLARYFEGVEDLLRESGGDIEDPMIEDEQTANPVEEVLFEDVRMGGIADELGSSPCEFLVAETVVQSRDDEPEPSPLETPRILDGTVPNDPLVSSLSDRVTRSQNTKRTRRPRATTPPTVPSQSSNQNIDDPTTSTPPSTSQTKKQKTNGNNRQPARKKQKKKQQKKKSQFTWKKGPFTRGVTLPENDPRPEDQSRKNPRFGPVSYFSLFFTTELIDYIVEQSKLYAFQETQKTFELDPNSIYDFLAVQIYMGVARMNSFRDYWSEELGYDQVRKIMSRNRYMEIRRFLHFSDNTQDTKEDRFFKIRPLFEYLRKKFLEFDGREKKYAIDEMMIKYKGKKAGSRKQYMPKKPIKWGFKFFGRSGVSGFVYDMIIYSGADTLSSFSFPFGDEVLTFSGKIVAALCQTIRGTPLSAVFVDNWFNSPQLMYMLRKIYGILSLGTLRADRTAGASQILSSDKEMAKKERGTSEIVSDNVKQICVVKWYDTKSVLLGSSYVGDEPISKVKRFSKEAKKKIPIDCPALVKEYNKFMGGVDKSDMLISIFKTPLKSFKWYMNIFSWLLDVTLCNAWILYREEHPDEKMGLKKFKTDVAKGLLLKGRPRNVKKSMAKTPHPRPSEEVRYDQFGHFPVYVSKGKCRNCHVGQTVWACSKCNDIRLCLNGKKNCFMDYHQPKSPTTKSNSASCTTMSR